MPLKSIEIDGIFDVSSSIYYYGDEEFCVENFFNLHGDELKLVTTFLNCGKRLETHRTKKGTYHGPEIKKFVIIYDVVKELLSIPRASSKWESKFC